MKTTICLLGLFLSFSSFAHVADELQETEDLSEVQAVYSQDFGSIARDLGVVVNDQGRCEYSKTQLNNVYMEKRYPRYTPERNLVLDAHEDLTPYWGCLFLRQNLNRDTRRRLDTPVSDVFNKLKTLPDQSLSIRGKLRYMGIVPKSYRYELDLKDGVATATVKVHLRLKGVTDTANDTHHRTIESKLAQAEASWNQNVAREVGPGFKFKFIKVENREDAHFSMALKKKFTRGPYDTRWSSAWSSTTIAHEIGHMLGLDDEYDNLKASTIFWPVYLMAQFDPKFNSHYDRFTYNYMRFMKCDQNSIMCNSSSLGITKYHIYTIFSRFFEQRDAVLNEELLAELN